jgi:hypothetical protein
MGFVVSPLRRVREGWETRLRDGFNPTGVEEGVSVLFKGYIDESYDKHQRLFTLSCMIGKGKTLYEMERLWKLRLRARNKQLEKERRKTLSRYHAADCNAREGEFHGWQKAERDEFVLELFQVFKRIPLHCIAIDMDLDLVCKVFPEFSVDRLRLAYMLLTDFLLFSIGEDFVRFAGGNIGDHKVTLFHDRTANGKYDATILRQFSNTLATPGFPHRALFTSITSFRWQDCVLLQPADLVAFEALRQAQHFHEQKDSRKSFDALVSFDTFGIHLQSFRDEGAVLSLRQKAGSHKSQYDFGGIV